MLLNKGDTILVANRRLFETEELRFFIGRVDEYEAGIVKATGRSYIHDVMSGRMIEKEDKRTRILSLSSGTFLVYQIPGTVSVEALKFSEEAGRLSLTDEKGFTMNLAEHVHDGRA
jgi:hypothetical protein